MRQRFFSPKGYKPRAYGYSQAEQYDDASAIVGYRVLRQLPEMEMIMEPYSSRARMSSLRRRPEGGKLLGKLRPDDHLVVAALDRMFVDHEDFVAQMRWFFEHGVHVHVLDLLGSPLDCWSPAGRIVLDAVLAGAQTQLYWRKVIRERKVKPKSKGKAIPWFCTLDISQNRLGQIPPHALATLKETVRQREELGYPWSRISAWLYDEWQLHTGGRKLAENRGKSQEAVNAYCFYKGWEEAGFPDLNDVSPATLRREYHGKLFGTRPAAAGADAAADEALQAEHDPSL